ncbi:MAG: D-alanine--D-alanine ligase [Bacteroidales bacterium]|nr:D-alanine--D-alanine ligase [Bacteroidales bacterium]
MKINLGLIFGGRSGEHEVSLQSAKSIAENVNREKYNLFLLAIDKEGDWFLADESFYLDNKDDPANIKLHINDEQKIALIPKGISNQILKLSDHSLVARLDVVFPIIHGTFGEDGSLQGFMSMLNIPCVGADVLGSAVGMDKLVAKKLLINEGINVARHIVADNKSEISVLIKEAEQKFGFPVFVKPACSGSSVGVYKSSDAKELGDSIKKSLHFDERVLIEEAIVGREIECSVLGNDELIASIAGEVIPKNSFYSYEAKYIDAEGAKLEMPAKLSENILNEIQNLAKKAYKVLSCSGMARVDMFLKEDNSLVLNEINTLPGFTKISMYPKLLDLTGIPFPELIERLIDLAIEKHQRKEKFLLNVLNDKSY